MDIVALAIIFTVAGIPIMAIWLAIAYVKGYKGHGKKPKYKHRKIGK